MQSFLAITKALSDASRVRALCALRGGELCLCQLIELLELTPSTISKHMELLRAAGLVEMTKRGKWRYFRLAGRAAAPEIRRAVAWTLDALADDAQVARDRTRLDEVCRKELQEVAACYR